jgi:drug/metabolite transporter (DMT)-like permease
METSGTKEEKSADIVLWLAFAAVYVLWGSTYLALHFVLESIPPFLMAAFRFITAGSIMFVFARLNKHAFPSREEIKNSAIIGFFLLVLGNGGVVWAQQYIGSGVTALIITIEPVWVVLLLWMKNAENKPTSTVWFGIVLGVSGMLILIGPSGFTDVEQLNPLGVIALLISSISWAIGSVYALKIKLPASSSMSTGFQMMAAGISMLMISTARAEWTGFDISTVTTSSILGFLYLVIFGSLIGFTSYAYIVKKANPTSVSTYAYVNPVIAVFLGWWIGNERVSRQTLLATLLLVSAVVIIIMKPNWKINFNYKKIKT